MTAALAITACASGRTGAGAPPVPAGGSNAAHAPGAPATSIRPRLPTGVSLDPAGSTVAVGAMPLSMALAPDARRMVLLLSGWREQGLQVVDRASGRVVQTLEQPSAFLGLVFSRDGRSLYTSGGNGDVIYRYAWQGDTAVLADSILLAAKTSPHARGRHYPSGLALSPDGTTLYAAENLADSLAVVDLASGRVTMRVATGRYPYGVAVAPDGTVYVSAWGGNGVSVYRPGADGGLILARELDVARHPSALLLNADGSRLFIASGSTDRVVVVDTRRGQPVTQLLDPPGIPGPNGTLAFLPGEGSTPNALSLSQDGGRLYVAEADNNAVAIFDLTPETANVPGATGDDRLVGRIPVEWYPTALLARGDTMLVATGKGAGTAPNPGGPNPLRPNRIAPRQYTLGQLAGTLGTIILARATRAQLAPYTARVSRANGWGTHQPRASYPPFEHVIYIIKENRTYDEVLGDLAQADGDTALLFFPRTVSPNHHALAERFGIFDRFFVNAEVSADGHNWSTAAYATDYVEKTVPSNYSGRGRSYDYEGTNRGAIPDDDVAEPARGYLWNLAQRAGITFRNYGEFAVPKDVGPHERIPDDYRGDKPYLDAHTDSAYPGFDLGIMDQHRADLWIAELHQQERSGVMPALEIVRLPNDHTSGARAGARTPRAQFADNDLALGRMIEALSQSPFWPTTVVFVVEDDAQNGPDHVDSHRAPFFVISPYNRPGVIHRFTNTTDVIATIAQILHLGSLSQFDFYGRPLSGIFASTPDLTPYSTLRPAVNLDERNPAHGPGARASERLQLHFEDESNDDLFNRILWVAIKGDSVPYPGPTRMSALEWKRGW
ncbi:MAG TPA: bifunctional YncE family protein/alkaline phosphatase family protein [Gemmatimonadaceae bacterium]|nr:bifunctional YncE family protein/alkaline phosphatase family protein [Gemmatimonadaceae bacterium]